MATPRHHIFVCTNSRPEGSRPCCGAGGQALYDALVAKVAEKPELWGQIRVTRCDCLGPCFEGPNLVVYPDGVWYRGAGPEDAGAIVDDHLVGGRVVERLRLEDVDE